MKKNILTILIVIGAVMGTAAFVHAASTYHQDITLEPGWSAVSTPRVLDSHAFTAPETSDNIDIFVLDASAPSGWATMADYGQTEFEPLYGYFINNKTGVDQTLTLNYKDGLSPADRLFEREFGGQGWYSIGVANPTHVVDQCSTTVFTPTWGHVMGTISGDYKSIIDFTYGEYDAFPRSVAVGDEWLDIQSFDGAPSPRETKGYGLYIKESGTRFAGFQNGDAVFPCPQGEPASVFFSFASSFSEPKLIEVSDTNETGGVLVYRFKIEEFHGVGGVVEDIAVHISSDVSDVANIVKNVRIISGGIQYGSDEQTSATGDSVDFFFENANLDFPAGGEKYYDVEVDLYAMDNQTNYSEGETLRAFLVAEGLSITDYNGFEYPEDGHIEVTFMSTNGPVHELRSEGVQLAFVSASESKDTEAAPDIGTFVLKFSATAFGSDIYIEETCGEDAGDGVDFGQTGSASISSCNVKSAGNQPTGAGHSNFRILDGDTITLTLTVAAEGDDEFAGIQLNGVDWSTTDIAEPLNVFDFNLDDYETDDIFLSGS